MSDMLLYDATSQVEASLDGDLVTYFAAGLIGLFAVLSWVLLSKYRTLTAKVVESTELGRGGQGLIYRGGAYHPA